MSTEEQLFDFLEIPKEKRDSDLIPANHKTRQQWQKAVEQLVLSLRNRFGQLTFGLSEAEISVHYHLPVHRFVKLVEQNLGFPDE